MIASLPDAGLKRPAVNIPGWARTNWRSIVSPVRVRRSLAPATSFSRICGSRAAASQNSALSTGHDGSSITWRTKIRSTQPMKEGLDLHLPSAPVRPNLEAERRDLLGSLG